MTTFTDVIEETQSTLRGYTRNQDQTTWLTDPLPVWGADSMKVADANRVNATVVEIEDELIEIDKIDRQSSIVTIPPYGRGAQGSTPAAHPQGVRVISDPLFPRMRVKRAINDSILGLAGDLFDVRKDMIVYDCTKHGFALPAAASGILDIRWRVRDSARRWIPGETWDVNLSADTTDFPSGVSVDIGDRVEHGASVLVTYSADPVEFSADDDTLADVGLPESARDLLAYGAVWRLLSNLDGARLASQTLAGRELAERMPVNVNSNLTQQIWRIYQVRLDRERKALLSKYPGQIHKIRS